MIKFPSVEQFRSVVKQVNDKATRDNTLLPTLKFRGTVKLHGTNASLVIYEDGTYECQSRNQVITEGHYGFVDFVNKNIETIMFNLSAPMDAKKPMTIYGEWCGEGIQKGVALSQLDKMFVVFGISHGVTDERDWVDPTLLNDSIDFNSLKDIGMYDINDFEKYDITIDFNNPKLSVNDMISITNEVEEECPVGKHFGVSSTGEGVVWKCIMDGYESSKYYFKIKGKKHSVTKVKTLVEVDIVKLKSINEFIDRVLTENRLQQGIEYLNEMGLEVSQKSTGEFLSWIFADCMKEEGDVLESSGLTKKDISRDLGKLARVWFFEKVNKI